MPEFRCSRCGRIEPAWESDDAIRSPRRREIVEPTGDVLSTLLGGTWAFIDGQDVCPQCQQRPEREALAGPIISAIQEWIQGRQEQGEPTSPFESGLVPHAMQLRVAQSTDNAPGESSAPALPGQGGESKDPSSDPGRTKLEVAVTGAFLTGCPLGIGLDEYRDVQRTLANKLREQPGYGWRKTADKGREGTYQSGGGFSSVLPLVVARRDGPIALARAKEILKARPRKEREWLEDRTEGWKFKPTSMRIDVYDLGVAVIHGTFDVRVPPHLSLATAAGDLKRMVWLRPDSERDITSPITGMFRKLCKETTIQFRAGVAATVPEKVQRLWLPPADPTRPTSPDWGRLLWLHPVHILEAGDPRERLLSAKALAPTFSRTLAVQDAQFVSGIGWSAIVAVPDKSADDIPLKLLLLQWAYIALYMEIDRGLLAVLDGNDAGTAGSSLSQLEDEASVAFADYIRVMEARARVDSALAGLGGDEQAIWDVISDVTKFGDLVDGVDRKVEVLQKLADRRVQQAEAISTRRSTRILGFLTTLTLVTLSVTLLGYFVGGLADDADDDHLAWRIGIVAAGLTVALLLWLGIFGWPRRKKR